MERILVFAISFQPQALAALSDLAKKGNFLFKLSIFIYKENAIWWISFLLLGICKLMYI